MVDQDEAAAAAQEAKQQIESLGGLNDVHKDALAQCRRAIDGWLDIAEQLASELDNTVKDQPEAISELAENARDNVLIADQTGRFPEATSAQNFLQAVVDHQVVALTMAYKAVQDSAALVIRLKSLNEQLELLYHGSTGVEYQIAQSGDAMDELIQRFI
jgi:hypothetical protein